MITPRGRIRTLSLVLGAAFVLAACGGGDDGSSGTDGSQSPDPNPPAGGGNPPPAGGNQAPVIGGSPQASVLQGNQYSFTPTASDADGDVLTFTISNMPQWADFDESTGALTGTPTAGDIGDYEDIAIAVTDGESTATLTAFDVSVVATAEGAATLSWTPPTTRSDGTNLSDLAGYKVYWGTAQGNYTNSVTIDNPGITTYMIDELTSATWYFAATAFDSTGLESQYSNVATKTIP